LLQSVMYSFRQTKEQRVRRRVEHMIYVVIQSNCYGKNAFFRCYFCTFFILLTLKLRNFEPISVRFNCRTLYLRTQSVPQREHKRHHYKDQFVNAVKENTCYLHWESCRTHKYKMQSYLLLKLLIGLHVYLGLKGLIRRMLATIQLRISYFP
jgi:hypothetical protein